MKTTISTAVILFLACISWSAAEDTQILSSNTNDTVVSSSTTATTTTTTLPVTTFKSTATSKVYNSSTVSPPKTTTPSPKSTTALPPEPKPSLWYVTDKSNNNTCLLLEAGIRLTFNYLNSSKKTVKDFSVDVPANIGDISGHCGALEQEITLRFFNTWSLSFRVNMNKTELVYDLSSVSLTYDITPEHFPDAIPVNSTTVSRDMRMFEAQDGSKYVCVASQTLISNNASLGLTSLTTYTLTLEAFRNSTNHAFTKNVVHCAHDEVSQLVPIIVGACLAGLIVIVLIAYIIGRQRSRGGYASV